MFCDPSQQDHTIWTAQISRTAPANQQLTALRPSRPRHSDKKSGQRPHLAALVRAGGPLINGKLIERPGEGPARSCLRILIHRS